MSEKPNYEMRRRQASERKRLEVLRVAGYCFAENGFKGTAMADIAARAGVSKGLVFHFFGSKQALFKAVVEDGLKQWATLSEYRAAGAEAEGNSLAELRSLFLASFDYIEQNPVLLLFDQEEEGLTEMYRTRFTRQNRHWRQRIQQALKSGIAAGEIRRIDVRRTALVFHQLQAKLLNAADLRVAKPGYDRQTLELAIEIFLRGISAQLTN